MNKPEQKFRAGPIEASVWKNERVKDGVAQEYRTITFQRRYKAKDGEWKSTNTLQVYDLPRALIVLGKAYEKLTLSTTELKEGEDDPEAVSGVGSSLEAEAPMQSSRRTMKVA